MTTSALPVALDGCVFTDNRKKCDGMFVLSRSDRTGLLLVEMKRSHLEDAYEQIAYVVNQRQEYTDIVSHPGWLGPRKASGQRDFSHHLNRPN